MSPDDAPAESTALVYIQTFLIADIRGYTAYTQSRGDERAAELAANFANLAGQSTANQGGRIVELRGDEVLAVFGSPRQALRAATDLIDQVAAQTEQVYQVGVGIDAGEAVPVEDGFRGGALNVAARLCSLAAPGRILTTDVVTHLARKVEGLRYVDQGAVELKGIDAPIRVMEVQREGSELALRPSGAIRRSNSDQIAPFADLLKDFGFDFGRRISEHVHAQLTESLAARQSPVTVLPAPVSPPPARGISNDGSGLGAKELAVIFGGVVMIVAIIAVVVIVIAVRL